jgi:hypothetical protein
MASGASVILHPDNPEIHSVSQFNHLAHLSGSVTLGVRDALFTADQLIRHGCYDRACRVIDSVAACGYRNETLNRRLEMLAKAAEQVRAIAGLDAVLTDSCMVKKLLSFRSCILGAGGAPNRLVIVYSTAWNNFDISFPFLHGLIASRADCIVYVKNPRRGMYATGNDLYGSSIDEMSSSICGLIAYMKPSRVTVLGFSGGGYAALHLAAKAGADAFLGLGIRTDLSKNSAFANIPGRTAPRESDYINNTLVNMRDVPEIAGIQRAVLYFGERDASDREHAQNMTGLPNFSIYGVQQGSHNLVMDFLVRGQLQSVLYNVLD